ncbi:MAG: iron transporter [Micromonosporaceae bacterium]|nr:iron transporter [Micromonosporaceae bacterium]
MLTAFFIMLREGFEAALVVAILYAYVRRTERHDLVRPIWAGVIAASAVSIGTGVAIHLTVESLAGAARLRAFALISVFAVIVLTWMVFWMRRHARGLRGELQHSIDVAATARGSIGLAVGLASFFAVLREGLEAALFLIAAATTDDGLRVAIGGLVGLTIACVMGYLVVLGGRRLPLRQFFQVTGVMLIVFAAGLLSRTVMFLQVAGDLPILWDNVYDLTAYDVLTVRTETGKFLGAMFGWDPRPSIEQVVAYLGYSLTVGYLFLRPSREAAPTKGTEPARQTEPAAQTD